MKERFVLSTKTVNPLLVIFLPKMALIQFTIETSTLAIELYKVWRGIAPKIMENVFPLNSNAKYLGQNDFQSRNVKHVNYGTDSLAHLGPKMWSMVPLQWKSLSLSIFSKKIRKWKPDDCPCRLCKTYVQNVGYVGKISY